MSNLSEISEIFDRCIKGTATQTERDIFYEWIEFPENRVEAIKLWETAFANSDGSLNMEDRKREGMIEAILNATRDLPIPTADFKSAANDLPSNRYSQLPSHRVHFLKTAWFRYAAAVMLLLSTGAYFWFQYGDSRQQKIVNASKHLPADILPGKEGAILTLADGSQVVLDSLGNGVIADQQGAQVVLQNGQLGYRALQQVQNEGGIHHDAGTMSYNTMTTPRGRQFQIVLPDGSKVWLNAASSLKYPTIFSGKQREVEVTGEAYFEITADKTKPFRVLANGMEVEVLGTNFNINAYNDEDVIRTTLLQGSVRLSAYKHLQTLKPGQQAQVSLGSAHDAGSSASPRTAAQDDGLVKVINDADVDQVLAWKNGFFQFNRASLQVVMRQLMRWYNIEVIYENNVPNLEFGGKMQRNLNLSDILEILTKSGIHFRLEEGRRLIVYP
ncbi:MAG TPA: FecR domain-containing protein [Puia sp.]|nr:FecR domain-containing protein [Puia sp.]